MKLILHAYGKYRSDGKYISDVTVYDSQISAAYTLGFVNGKQRSKRFLLIDKAKRQACIEAITR